MVPGIWLEPEVIGVRSPLAHRLPESAFFQRMGRRVVEQERYLLDLRDPAARGHLDAMVDRLIDQLGVGYFKFDYNVTTGVGTDSRNPSPGDGLLGHNRAYLEWIDDLHRRYPDLIIENCASGAMRMDGATLSRVQLQSTSDQTDWRAYPTIAAAAGMMMLPEQAANWAYPQADFDERTNEFILNTTMLGRCYLSGYLNRMSDAQIARVRDAVEEYKRYVRPFIADSVPFWSAGLPGWEDRVVAYGLRTESRALVTVWCRDADMRDVELPVPGWAGCAADVQAVFPGGDGERDAVRDWSARWNPQSGALTLALPQGVHQAATFLVRLA